jgi:hypothetical protein
MTGTRRHATRTRASLASLESYAPLLQRAPEPLAPLPPPSEVPQQQLPKAVPPPPPRKQRHVGIALALVAVVIGVGIVLLLQYVGVLNVAWLPWTHSSSTNSTQALSVSSVSSGAGFPFGTGLQGVSSSASPPTSATRTSSSSSSASSHGSLSSSTAPILQTAIPAPLSVSFVNATIFGTNASNQFTYDPVRNPNFYGFGMVKIATTDQPLCFAYKGAFSTGRVLVDNTVQWLGMPSIQYQSMPDRNRGQSVPLFGGTSPNVPDPEYPGPTNGAQKLEHQLYGLYCTFDGNQLGTFSTITPYLGFQNTSLTQAGTPFFVGIAFYIDASTWTMCTPSGSCTTDGAVAELYPPDLLLRIPDSDNTQLYFDIPAAEGVLNNHDITPGSFNYIIFEWSVYVNSTQGELRSWQVLPNPSTGSWLLDPSVTLINDYSGPLLTINNGSDANWTPCFGPYGGQQSSALRTLNIGQVNLGNQLLHAYPQLPVKTIVDMELFRFSALTLASTPGALTQSNQVNYWNNSSSNKRQYSAVPGIHTTTLPVYSASCMGLSLPGVSFPASSALVGPVVLPVGYSFSLMALITLSSATLQQAFMGQQFSYVDAYGVSAGVVSYIRNNAPSPIGTQSLPLNTPTLITLNYDYSYLSYSLFINGAPSGVLNTTYLHLHDPSILLGCSLNSYCWGGCIGELVLYNLMLTPAQQQQEEQSLRAKWGL